MSQLAVSLPSCVKISTCAEPREAQVEQSICTNVSRSSTLERPLKQMEIQYNLYKIEFPVNVVLDGPSPNKSVNLDVNPLGGQMLLIHFNAFSLEALLFDFE